MRSAPLSNAPLAALRIARCSFHAPPRAHAHGPLRPSIHWRRVRQSPLMRAASRSWRSHTDVSAETSLGSGEGELPALSARARPPDCRRGTRTGACAPSARPRASSGPCLARCTP
eukprot:2657123-Rhodomonas_salina.8